MESSQRSDRATSNAGAGNVTFTSQAASPLVGHWTVQYLTEFQTAVGGVVPVRQGEVVEISEAGPNAVTVTFPRDLPDTSLRQFVVSFDASRNAARGTFMIPCKQNPQQNTMITIVLMTHEDAGRALFASGMYHVHPCAGSGDSGGTWGGGK